MLLLQKMKSWWAKDTDQKVDAVSLILVGIVWSTVTQTWISDATAVIFSIKCFNPVYSQAFIDFSIKSHSCNGTFTNILFLLLLTKNM